MEVRMPHDKVIIIIPSQGDAKNAFEDVARKLKKEVYSNATIVKTTVTDSSGAASVAFTTLDGHPFAWDRTHNVSRVLTISHGFAADGPNLAMLDSSVPVEEHQPWGSKNEGRDLLAGLGLVMLVLASARPALSLQPESLCWRDYPIPVTAVNYEKAFASETLAPDPISINGKVVTTGIAEKTLDGLLGVASTVVEDWQQRSDQEQCEYLLEELRH